VPFILTILLLFSFSFAKGEPLGAGAKELAKGNAAVADTSAFFAAYWNTGMLAFKRDLSIAAHLDNRSLGRAGGAFGIDAGVGNRVGIGAALLARKDSTESDTVAYTGYIGLGYRLSKTDAVGFSYQNPFSFNMGWFKFWNEKWQSGLQIGAKAIEAGVTHRNLFFSKPASVSLSLLSYQEDSILAFDPDEHVLRGRFGFEWRGVTNGDLRLGIDGKNPSVGWGYAFCIGDKILFIDYALMYEWEADLLNPLSLSLRMKF
jgi:hypothetical protein